MNILVLQIINKIQTGGRDVQIEGALELTLLLEKTLFPGRYESTHRMILSKELMRLDLYKVDVDELLNWICSEVGSERLNYEVQISLVGILGKVADARCLDAMLNFLQAFSGSLNDDQIYSVVTSMTPACSEYSRRNEIAAILDKHHAPSLFEQLSRRSSQRLKELVSRLSATIEKLNSN